MLCATPFHPYSIQGTHVRDPGESSDAPTGEAEQGALTCPYAQSTARGCGLAPLVWELGPMVTAGGEFIRA